MDPGNQGCILRSPMAHAKQSVVVPVALVSRVPVAVVHVVHVVTVRNRHMPATLAVRVGVIGVLPVLADLALVRVTVVLTVQMPVVHVIDMIAVRDCYVPAARSVRVVMTEVRLMLQGCRHFTHLHKFRPPPFSRRQLSASSCFLPSRPTLPQTTRLGKQAQHPAYYR